MPETAILPEAGVARVFGGAGSMPVKSEALMLDLNWSLTPTDPMA